MEKLENIKNIILSNLKTNLDLIDIIAENKNQAKKEVLEELQKYISVQLSNTYAELAQEYAEFTPTPADKEKNALEMPEETTGPEIQEPSVTEAFVQLDEQTPVQVIEEQVVEESELSGEELERQVQEVLDYIKEHNSFNTLTPIPKEVLKEVNRRLDDMSHFQQNEDTISQPAIAEPEETTNNSIEQTENSQTAVQDAEMLQPIEENLEDEMTPEEFEREVQSVLETALNSQNFTTFYRIPKKVLEEVNRRLSEINKNKSLESEELAQNLEKQQEEIVSTPEQRETMISETQDLEMLQPAENTGIESEQMTPEEFEREVQSVLESAQNPAGFSTLAPISRDVLEEANNRLAMMKKEQQEYFNSSNNPTTEENSLQEEKVMEQPPFDEKREAQIQSLVDYYLEHGKLNSLSPIPPDILDEVSKRIVSHHIEEKKSGGLHK